LVDIDQLFYNFVHFLGALYDNTIALIDIFRFGDPKETKYWKELGFYFGTMINDIFYKPDNYQPYVPPKLFSKYGR
jgi:hypothetical protein